MSMIDPYREQLAQRWERESDPAVLYYDRLLRWKGTPTFRLGARPQTRCRRHPQRNFGPFFDLCIPTKPLV